MKLENIMMSSNNDQGIPKIVDFGLSTVIAPEQISSDPVGTLAYAAPEIFLNQSYTKCVDVWSLGNIIHCLLLGHLPFDHDDQ